MPVVLAVSLGGGLGALARYGVGLAFPAAPGAFPWGTFVVNAAGCFLMGVLMVLATELVRAHRLVRPFLGVGVLGGFTTFSTYAVETRQLLADAPGVAVAYLIGTVLTAIVAVLAGVWLVRRLARRP
ncbi:fluoride efflux transporter CrcB [Kibdelosporangium persicum]|uniref:Fluoride-specific ion channel FluC n=1 Tax=Kibdelosporangium persicum TaxID=2698649 RepID=A0ABX2F3P7_9PSEU|nr:fluoride efflux transporter CrcB [Kibdelosporangium persicum]NRN65961.1 Fluoride efflux transporter CrcB [Kibdelosporangium persicum]